MRKRVVVVLIVAIVAAGAWWFFFRSSSRGEDEVLIANADDLKATVVTPHLECPIEDGKNVLWCATFQLAWNEACDLIGEDIHLEDEPAMVAVMNKKTATKADLDEASYLAIAGYVKDGILDRIPQAVRDKFGERAPTRLADTTTLDESDNGFAAYACLVKDLRFAKPFESLDDGELEFMGTPVRAFGLADPDGKANTRELMKQVILYSEDWRGNEIICELKTTSPHDRLILAMVHPKGTLQETIADIHKRMADGYPQSTLVELMIPKLNFDLLKDYSELIGKTLKVRNPELKDWFFVMAAQSIRFQLNEQGAKLRSEARMENVKSMKPMPAVFNKPFLIMLQRKDAKQPYFALWVDNVELLMAVD